jgi:hypothetical protein
MTKEAYLSSLVPRMYKSEFDDKAAEILAQHCPEALEKPMPVPIEEIARDKLHLLIKEYLTATTPQHPTRQLNIVTSNLATQLSHFLS